MLELARMLQVRLFDFGFEEEVFENVLVIIYFGSGFAFQAENEALMFQQYIAAADNGAFERRVRPYIEQIQLVMLKLLWLVFGLDRN